MKTNLDWQDPEIVSIFEEVTLWSAPFGRMLLDHIPMTKNAKVLDLGFGTGFPLLELSQRFGANASIYGMDIWKAGIARTKKKINLFEFENIQIFEQSASEIPLANQAIDLICSNLGVNNFEEKTKVFEECYRVLKSGGSLCLTTNPIGTFAALFDLFLMVMAENNWDDTACQNYIQHRATKETIVAEIEQFGFTLQKEYQENSLMRFVDAKAVFDHTLMRISFNSSWANLVPSESRGDFFESLQQKIESIIEQEGEFRLSIPMLYLEFGK